MDKQEILGHLRAARRAHIAWVQRAKALVAGVPLSEDQIPVNATECKFGFWFYEEGIRLKKLPNFQIIDDIERLHIELHDEYLKIFQIFFGGNKGFFAKIFNFKKKKISPEDKKYAQIILSDLEKTSEELLKNINLLERRIEALQESTFDSL